MRSILAAKGAGEELLEIQRVLKPATKSSPVETDMGSYNSFNHFLKQNKVNRTSAYRYIKLAENWDIVLALGMQDEAEDKLSNNLRLIRTLKVIDWYKAKIKAGADALTLTLKLYWLEDKTKKDKPGSVPYKDLVNRVNYLECYVSEVDKERDYYKERCQILEEQLAATIN